MLLLAELLGEECDMPDGCAEALCDALLSFVLRGQGSAPDQGAGEVLRIRKSLLYLDAHFREAPTLSELAAPVVLYPQYTQNIRVKDKGAVLADSEVLKKLSEVEALIAGKGRALLRKSGTEPVIRIMIESESEEKCKEYAALIAQEIEDRGHKAQ